MWGFKRDFGGEIVEKWVFWASSPIKIPLKMHVIYYNTSPKLRNSIFRNFGIFLPIMAQLFGKKFLGLRSTRGV